MKFIAEINVMPLKALLDPQGKAVSQVMQRNGFAGIGNIRVGKHLTLEISADSEEKAGKIVDDACRKVLINPIVEHYEFSLHKL